MGRGQRWDSGGRAPVNPSTGEEEPGEPSVPRQPGLNSEILSLDSPTSQVCVWILFCSRRNVKERGGGVGGRVGKECDVTLFSSDK